MAKTIIIFLLAQTSRYYVVHIFQGICTRKKKYNLLHL